MYCFIYTQKYYLYSKSLSETERPQLISKLLTVKTKSFVIVKDIGILNIPRKFCYVQELKPFLTLWGRRSAWKSISEVRTWNIYLSLVTKAPPPAPPTFCGGVFCEVSTYIIQCTIKTLRDIPSSALPGASLLAPSAIIKRASLALRTVMDDSRHHGVRAKRLTASLRGGVFNKC